MRCGPLISIGDRMKKMLFIVNPQAGQRKARRYLADMIDIFNRADYEVSVYMTSGTGTGAGAVKQMAAGKDLVVCTGGDGTFNETVSGLLQSGESLPVGYIPAGSTNDFATSLELSGNILQAARDVMEGQPEPIDVGSFGGRYFSYIASFGAFTRASYLTPQSAKNVLGHAAYVLGGIQELSQLHPWAMSFELPDGQKIEGEFIFGAISNSTSVGGVLTLDKEWVDLCDGKFELLLIRAPKDLKELAECVLALQRKTYDSSMLTFLHTPYVTVHASKEMEWTLDGEWEAGHEKVEVRCIHKAISIIRNH